MSTINQILLMIIAPVALVAIVAAWVVFKPSIPSFSSIWRGSNVKNDDKHDDKHSDHDDHHPKPPTLWEKFWFWFGIIATLVVGVISIAWFINRQSNSRPERKEFSAYYRYEEDGESGGMVMVKITPDTINFGFPSKRLGGSITMRWSRGGGGTWVRRLGDGMSESGALVVKNVTGDKEKDFQEWKSIIAGEIDGGSTPGSCRISLTR